MKTGKKISLIFAVTFVLVFLRIEVSNASLSGVSAEPGRFYEEFVIGTGKEYEETGTSSGGFGVNSYEYTNSVYLDIDPSTNILSIGFTIDSFTGVFPETIFGTSFGSFNAFFSLNLQPILRGNYWI